MGRMTFIKEDWAHLGLYINREDKEFIDRFAQETYRDITGVVRFAISELKKQHNNKEAEHGDN